MWFHAYCVHTGKRITEQYCPDCKRMDCAVSFDELQEFQLVTK